MANFKVEQSCPKTRARAGTLTLSRGQVQTPVFMPCGTKGMVKTMLPDELRAIGTQIMLGNAYHLYLRPGDELIAEMGGLAKWNDWNAPMLTDSGGFQVFSLQGTRTGVTSADSKGLVKITDDGVSFKSWLDGSEHFFSPEKAMQIQANLAADIMMAFDECAAADVSKDYAKSAMERTHRWFARCYKEQERLQALANKVSEQVLFPIIQGGMFEDLRVESAKTLNAYPGLGIAIGGLSVGESKETMSKILDVVVPELNPEKARYLMGVGSPEDLVEGVARGVDMFDCVLATRLARHGCFWDRNGRQNLRLEKYRKDERPLMEDSDCQFSKNFSRSFIRHLLQEKEITGIRLLTLHNLRFLMRLMEEIRASIFAGNFSEYRENFWASWEK